MKKILSLVLVLTVLTGSIFVLTGCDKDKDGNTNKIAKEDNTTKITYTHGKGIVTLSVPKDSDGNAKYTFTTTKPEGVKVSGTFYLVTDKTTFVLSTSGLSYNTSQKYIAKYGDVKATFAGYLEFIEDTELFNKKINIPGSEQFEINGRKALRYYSRVGSSGNYTYNGYFYMVEADDIYPGSKFNMLVLYNDEEKPTEAKEFDKETLDIIKSLKLEANTNK